MSAVLNPWVLLGLLLAAIGLFAGGVESGMRYSNNKCIAENAQSQERAKVAADAESARRYSIGEDREKSRGKIKVIYRTIKQEAEQNVDKNSTAYSCGLDADGLRIWNAANSGVAAAVSGEPDYSLPGTAAGEVGKIGGLGGQPRRGDGDVQAMPGSASEASGMRQ